MYSNNYSNDDQIYSWSLPEKYSGLPNSEKAVVIRHAVLSLLKAKGAASKSVISREIGVASLDTVQKALNYLVTTQQIYFDPAGGSKDPVYYPNGRLAHPRAQRMLDGIGRKYVIRAYDDYRNGVSITVTEYSNTTFGESEALGGIRIDLRDLKKFISELEEERLVISREEEQ